MSRATSINSNRRTSAPASRRNRRIGVAVFSAVGALIISYIALATLFPAGVKISPGDGSQDVAVDSQLKVSTSWMRGSVQSVSVKETALDATGTPTGERTISGRMDGDTFVGSDGPLRLKADSRYEVTVSAQLTELTATGPRSNDVTTVATFTTIITPAPLFSQGAQVVPVGEPIVVEFNTPIKSFDYDIQPHVDSTSMIDPENPTRALITFSGDYEQGQKYNLTVTGALAENGVQQKKAYSQPVATTDPLKVTFVPGDGEAGVSTESRPTLTFSEDIKNQDQAESMISIDPSTVGAWNWISSDTIEFKPLSSWTQGQKITIHLKGGTDGLRGQSGSYVREDVDSTFTVKPSKTIEVNLTEQKLYAYDSDQLVRTIIVSSGSQATPSLTGTYAIYAKAEKVDMRGDGYFAPNVPWVLMFNGDYTIHGNYWATRFGVPTSHGCVGLPIDEAQWLFNWTPIGTIVQIHY